jgi:DNA invertase Pin-like site-specific DNA recombinase
VARGKFLSYLRVSTDKQGRSGLGLEAQRMAVEGYLNGGRWTLTAEYVEAESGKRSDRPKLTKALAHAKAIGATVVFAKLDRLTRNVDLLRSLVASDVDLVFCDLPHVPPGAMGRFLLTQMASVAELEAGLISERTKAALAAAKARGVKLGNPNGARALKGKQVGNKQAVAAVRTNAEHVRRTCGPSWMTCANHAVQRASSQGNTHFSLRSALVQMRTRLARSL